MVCCALGGRSNLRRPKPGGRAQSATAAWRCLAVVLHSEKRTLHHITAPVSVRQARIAGTLFVSAERFPVASAPTRAERRWSRCRPGDDDALCTLSLADRETWRAQDPVDCACRTLPCSPRSPTSCLTFSLPVRPSPSKTAGSRAMLPLQLPRLR